MSQAHVRRDMRKHPRRAVDLPVLVIETARRTGGAVSFTSSDLSQGGAFLRSELLFEVGEILNLAIQLAVGPDGHRLAARARVVRVSRNEAAPGMGLEFIDLSPEGHQALEQALSAT